MRLRKIMLGKSGELNERLLLLGKHRGLETALGMYLDNVSDRKIENVGAFLREQYRFCSTEELPCLDTAVTANRYTDFLDVVADDVGKTAASTTQNRHAFFVHGLCAQKMSYFTHLGIGGRYFPESPMIRANVPAFEDGCAYLEIAPWDLQDAVARIVEQITEFETPEHQQLLKGMRNGEVKHYARSALYDHLFKTKETYLW